MDDFEVHVTVPHGQVGERLKDYARAKVTRVAKLAPERVLFARVALTLEGNPATPRPAVAQATLDVNGRPVRAAVAGSHMEEAVDLLEDRLRHQLEHLSDRLEALRQVGTAPRSGEWRHNQIPTPRREFFPRPVEERELVRHKTFAFGQLTPDEAVFDMELLDRDFYLFTDLETGRDAVAHRLPGEGVGLAVAGGADKDLARCVAPIQLSPDPPTIGVDEAVERLNLTEEAFVFFVDPDSGRGMVVYRRYDGHHGLITPST